MRRHQPPRAQSLRTLQRLLALVKEHNNGHRPNNLRGMRYR